ncbi:MAG TPA: hypothetical protein VIJ27_00835, partial [Mucilaginibacter sp.]
ICNGICLYVEYDALFDKGFIALTDNLEIIITTDTSKCSSQLFEKLNTLKGRKLRQPVNKLINKDYLDYHRTIVFEKWTKKISKISLYPIITAVALTYLMYIT